MQTAKNAAASTKESASNMAATAKASMDKTKANVQEKAEKMTSHDPVQKDMATRRKEEKVNQAELNKQVAKESNAAATQQVAGGGGGGGGVYGHSTGVHQPGQVTDGAVGSQPVGMSLGMGGTTANNPHVGGGATRTGHGTGGGYS